MLIGEVSRRSGVSARMLRHYDALGLVRPTGRTSGGYREYSADDIRRLFHVESLRTLGLSLSETGRALDEPGFAPAELVGELIRHTRERIAAEQELLAKLEHVDSAAPAVWDGVLSVVTALRALESESAARRQQAILSQDEHATLPVGALAAAALSEDDPYVAGALRWSLARADGRGLADLAVGLGSAEAGVRRRATEAIAAVRTTEATVLLRRALDDPDAEVRDRAALALAARSNTDPVPDPARDGRRGPARRRGRRGAGPAGRGRTHGRRHRPGTAGPARHRRRRGYPVTDHPGPRRDPRCRGAGRPRTAGPRRGPDGRGHRDGHRERAAPPTPAAPTSRTVSALDLLASPSGWSPVRARGNGSRCRTPSRWVARVRATYSSAAPRGPSARIRSGSTTRTASNSRPLVSDGVTAPGTPGGPITTLVPSRPASSRTNSATAAASSSPSTLRDHGATPQARTDSGGRTL